MIFFMNVGIVGLGLIGGSFAKAFKSKTEHTVFGLDRNEKTLAAATAQGALDGTLTQGNIGDMDLLLLALYPGDSVDYLTANGGLIKKGAVTLDACGVKRTVCERLTKVAAKNGFAFIGGHPMAGIARSGFSNANGELFKGAPMILTPDAGVEAALLDKLEGLFMSLGFGSVVLTTPAIHDEMIAYTSQLAHVLSSAYVKTEAAKKHRGFSAGSFGDMTRVARLNEAMWTELFLENADNLAAEIEGLAQRLSAYAAAIRENDGDKLFALLKEGRLRKEAIEAEELPEANTT
jgi:prephenate dehydrogenase